MEYSFKPPSSDIEDQLRRILDSRYFKHAGVQAAIFRRIVESGLYGTPIKQSDLLATTQTHSMPDSHKARQNAFLIRKKVLDFYENEGRDDIVYIDLRPGRSYKVDFSYRVNPTAIRAFEQGVLHKKQMTELSLHNATQDFKKARNAKNTPVLEASACIELGETQLLRSLVMAALGRGPTMTVGTVQLLAEEALVADSTCNQAYLLAGASYLMSGEHGSARAAFEHALTVDYCGTTNSLWYAAFLATTDGLKEAIHIARRRVELDPDSGEVSLIYALFLYLDRQTLKAKEALFCGVDSHGIFALKMFVAGLISLELGDADTAFKSFKIASRPDYTEMQNDEQLSSLLQGIGDLEVAPLVREEMLSGLLSVALSRLGRMDEAAHCFESLMRCVPKDYFQLAIVFANLGLAEDAFQSLDKCGRSHVFRHFMHILRIFDPLRAEQKFKGLTDSILTPTHSSQEWFRIR